MGAKPLQYDTINKHMYMRKRTLNQSGGMLKNPGGVTVK